MPLLRYRGSPSGRQPLTSNLYLPSTINHLPDEPVLLRLVRMTFHPEVVSEFLAIFDESADKIRSFPGCLHLELWRDLDDPNAFTTYSRWDNQHALDRYRNSDLFTSTWARTKVLFAAPPQVSSNRLIRPHSAPESA